MPTGSSVSFRLSPLVRLGAVGIPEPVVLATTVPQPAEPRPLVASKRWSLPCGKAILTVSPCVHRGDLLRVDAHGEQAVART